MQRRMIGMLTVTLGLVAAACSAGGASPTSAPYENLDGPTLVASADEAEFEAKWEELVASSLDLERLGDGVGTIAGFEPFNDPGLALSDGRYLVRGRSESDQPIAGWYQRNPDSLVEGEDNPVLATEDLPVRLFVYDPEAGDIRPVSHIPEVHSFSTAVSVGESADVVLDMVVLDGEQVVAYTSGFNGAAYDIARAIYVAPIPAR